MSEKFVIGLVGEMGSGKETFGEALLEYLREKKKVSRITFSSLLRQTLELWDIPATRENLQKLAQVMDGGYGKGTLAKAMKHSIVTADANIVILDGVRWESDYELIRSFPKNALVYITADPKTRFDRLRARREKTGESEMTWETFEKVSAAPNEIGIASIGSRANMRVENTGTLEEFLEKAREYAEEILNETIKNKAAMPERSPLEKGRDGEGFVSDDHQIPPPPSSKGERKILI